MAACASCGQENPEGARFCNACAAPLADGPPEPREERKIVTILFADLVGFTARAERLDPEDVRAILNPYYTRLRTEIEAFGGVVEKFIGDAVMAVFGAPVAHGDDPERAVRAALAVRGAVAEMNAADADLDLQVRLAVNPGEAIVSLDAKTELGEGMVAGDVVNAASRLQTAAPTNAVLVGEETYRATRALVDAARRTALGCDWMALVWNERSDAEVCEAEGHPERSPALFQKALALIPPAFQHDATDVRIALAQFLIRQRRPAEARPLLEAARDFYRDPAAFRLRAETERLLRQCEQVRT